MPGVVLNHSEEVFVPHCATREGTISLDHTIHQVISVFNEMYDIYQDSSYESTVPKKVDAALRRFSKVCARTLRFIPRTGTRSVRGIYCIFSGEML